MMRKRLKIQAVLLFTLLLVTLAFAQKAEGAWKEEKVPVTDYELGKGDDYELKAENKVASMSFGKSGAGILVVQGDINETASYQGKTAYGVESGNISFVYKYDGGLSDSKGDNHFISDKTKEFMGKKLDANILNGVVLVQKSTDGTNWTDIGNPVVNFFEGFTGSTTLYTTDGNDVTVGTFYRVIVAYKAEVKVGTGKFLFFWDKDKTETYRNIEVYDFYLCKNDAVISLHNLSVDHIEDSYEGYSIAVLEKAETLTDGATVTKGFRVDKLGTTYSVKVNGTEAFDGKTFTNDGKYTVEVSTKLGKKSVKTVYVMNGGNDKGYSTYFGDSLIQGKRVFKEDQKYPCYAVNAKAKIQAVADSIPYMTGTISNVTTGDVIKINSKTRVEQVFELKEGMHYAELYSGNTESGTVFCYKFYFRVLSEDAIPYVNYKTLMNRNELMDLQTKHYEVSYQTTRGGNISVCFADYEDAFAYAYEIEKRFVEKNKDGVYYKSPDNPHVKTRYKTSKTEDKIRLTKALTQYARGNVEMGYFNAKEIMTYRTLPEGDDILECLEMASISDSVKVFSNNQERDNLIKRVPYINGYTYMYIGDYESKNITAILQDDLSEYNIEFGEKVDDQLERSGAYTIKETNQYGDEMSYDVVFMGNNVTEVKAVVSSNGDRSELTINDNQDIETDYFSLCEASNKLDDYAIVNIHSVDTYDYEITCLITEAQGLTLYEKGTYRLSFVDRVGNCFVIMVTITGNSIGDNSGSDDAVSYVELYNKIYLHDISID